MKTKHLIMPTLMLAASLWTNPVFARYGESGQYISNPADNSITPIASPMIQTRQRITTMQENRININEDVEASRSMIRETVQNRLENLRNLAATKSEQLKLKAQTMTQEQRDELKAQVQTKKEEMKAKIQEKAIQARSDMAARHATRLENRFSHYTDRLTQLANKFQERVELMAEEGKDVEAAQAKINQAFGYLEIASEQAEAAISMFTEIDPSNYDSQAQIAQQAAEQAKQARTQFKLILDTLKEALQLMKKADK